jgi:transcriptional antiterminator
MTEKLQTNYFFNMEKQKAIDIIDKMISQVPAELKSSEIWVSNDIYDVLNIKEYKGYKIYTSKKKIWNNRVFILLI